MGPSFFAEQIVEPSLVLRQLAEKAPLMNLVELGQQVGLEQQVRQSWHERKSVPPAVHVAAVSPESSDRIAENDSAVAELRLRP